MHIYSRPYVTIALLLSSLALAACIDQSGPCNDGVYCPTGQVCVPGRDKCAPHGVVEPCRGLAEKTPCASATFDEGMCRDGVCVKFECGNTFKEPGETCDDGNTEPGDGCSPDCITPCGDGKLDTNEVCDTQPPNQETCVSEGYDMGVLGCADSCQALDTSDCRTLQWDRYDDIPDNWSMAAVWAFSADNVYAVGTIGELTVEAAACSDCGRIFHYDGESWRAYSPSQSGTRILTDIWAASPTDIFVSEALGPIWHFDGSDWTPIDLILPTPLAFVVDMWGTSAENIFAISRGFDIGGGVRGYVSRFDGDTWSLMQLPIETELHGLWGADTDDVYAVGTSDVIMHYDGNQDGLWTVEHANPAQNRLRSIWGSDAELVAVGTAGFIMQRGTQNNDDWVTVESGVEVDLLRVWSDDRGDFYAVGNEGTVLRKERGGQRWIRMNAPTVTEHVLGIHGTGPGNMFAVGLDGAALHCCGWSRMETPDDMTKLRVLTNINDECIYAAGNSGSILRHDMRTDTFEYMDSGAIYSLNDFWGPDCDSLVYAVGNVGTIWKYDGSSWISVQSGVTANLRGVDGTGADDIFAVGEMLRSCTGTAPHGPAKNRQLM